MCFKFRIGRQVIWTGSYLLRDRFFLMILLLRRPHLQFLGVSSYRFVTSGRASRLTASDTMAGSLNFVQTGPLQGCSFCQTLKLLSGQNLRDWQWGAWRILMKDASEEQEAATRASMYWYGKETLIAWETLP